ncbi:MAG: DUF4339 domain-containing protein [Planctomycetes bacterium]|jgi:hypothetical protein|nr:DUF4339 domain-containing protein [Planctomycetota bacterium]
MGQWYCVVQGQQYGPVDEAAVRQWIQEGRLLPLLSKIIWS